VQSFRHRFSGCCTQDVQESYTSSIPTFASSSATAIVNVLFFFQISRFISTHPNFFISFRHFEKFLYFRSSSDLIFFKEIKHNEYYFIILTADDTAIATAISPKEMPYFMNVRNYLLTQKLFIKKTA
jgi:hypothetical protein